MHDDIATTRTPRQITLAALLLCATATATASTFAAGERVEIEASGHWVPCVVVDDMPDRILRVQCEAYPALSRAAGSYTTARDPASVRRATGAVGKSPAAPPLRTADVAGAGLKPGEYACYGVGGRLLVGLGFKILAGNRYTDLDDGNAGSFSVTGGDVQFRGGHLDGQSGRNLRGHAFTLGANAGCEPF